MKKIILSILAVFAVAFAASAQRPVEMNHDFTQFDGICVTDAFEVTYIVSQSYSAKIVVDEIVADYVKTYIKGHTLYVDLDEKSFPKELKKMLKGKNAIAPVLKATIYSPVLSSITLKNSVKFNCDENLKLSSVKITLENSAEIKRYIVDAQDITLNMSNSSSIRIDAYASTIDMLLKNSAKASCAYNCTTLNVKAENSANITVDGEIRNVNAKASNSSKLVLHGNSDILNISGENSSSIDSERLNTLQANVTLSGAAECYVNAKDNLKVNLQGSSKLVFSGSPVIDDDRIISATMIRSTDPKNKK